MSLNAGTVRDTAAIAAVQGFYLNRGVGPSKVAPGVANEENHGTSIIEAGNSWLVKPNRSISEGAMILDQVAALLESSGTTPMNLPVSGFARRLAAVGATLSSAGRRQMVRLLEAQLDALATSMDGPVGVNSNLLGHNISQYDTWEPGIAIFHRPNHGVLPNASTVACCEADALALCG